MSSEDIKKALSLLYEPGEVFEVRMLPKGKNPVMSGYFNDIEKCAEVCFKMDGIPEGIYTTINPCKPELLARAYNRIEPQKASRGNSTTEPDILKRKWLMFDIDAVRPSGISASNQEHELAINTAYDLADKLKTDMGFPEAIIGDSGNGGHLKYGIDLPNDKDAKELLERFYKLITEKYNTVSGIDIQTFADANRIWKLKGTKVCKGDNLPDRPHRYSKLLEVPDKREIVTIELLQKIADTLPKDEPQPSKPKTSNKAGKAWDADKLEAWLKEHGAVIERMKKDGDITRFVLKACLMNPEHEGHKEAEVHIYKNGMIGYKCHHNSCSNVSWVKIREKLDPKYGKAKKGSLIENYFTDQGKFIVKNLGDDIMTLVPIITMNDNLNEMYVYENGVYNRTAELSIRTLVTKLLGNKVTKHYIAESEYYIQTMTAIPRSSVNKDTTKINVKNGLYNIKTGVLEPHNPAFISTQQIPINYNAEAECPLIATFLSQILPLEDAALILQLFGYLLIPNRDIQKAFMLTGDGSNGKGTLTRLLVRFLGRDNCSTIALKALNEDKFAVANLYGKLANICPDLPAKTINDDTAFKAITGKDTLTGERKYEKAFDFDPFVRLVFSANDLPYHPKSGYAWNRRWIIVNFMNRFEGKRDDKELDLKLQTDFELSGLLSLALIALKWLLRTKEYYYFKTPKQVGEEYDLKSDPLSVFMKECTVHSDDYISTKALYEVYGQWGKMRKIQKILAHNIFGKYLKRAGFVPSKPFEEGKRLPPGYEGISLNLEMMDLISKTKSKELSGLANLETTNSFSKNKSKELSGLRYPTLTATLTDFDGIEGNSGFGDGNEENCQGCKGKIKSEFISAFPITVTVIDPYSTIKQYITNNPDNPDTIKTSNNSDIIYPTYLDIKSPEKVAKSGKIWEKQHQKSINNLTKTAFVFWYCEENKEEKLSPSEIMSIVEKVFKITPETPGNTEEKGITPEQPQGQKLESVMTVEVCGVVYEGVVE